MARIVVHLPILVSLLLAGCIGSGSFAPHRVPEVGLPEQSLSPAELQEYVIAYCWRSLQRDAFNQGSTEVVVSNGDGSRSSILSITPSPPNTRMMLACFSNDEQDFRVGDYSMDWRPTENQLTMVVGPTIGLTGFYFAEIPEPMLEGISGNYLGEPREYFYNPNSIDWSPDGRRLATVGGNANTTHPYLNIWVYNPTATEAFPATSNLSVGSIYSRAVWSPDGKRLAIGYELPHSGVAIAVIKDHGVAKYIDVSSRNQSSLQDWPYLVGSPAEFLKSLLSANPLALFRRYLTKNSGPVWEKNGSKIVFSAPTDRNRVALFRVGEDGVELEELLRGLPGLSILPTLSPDGKDLAFVRYPDWKDTGRAEIALYNFEAQELSTLAVLPEPENGDRLYISGMDWTPDGEYLAISSNHEGRSNIYVISKAGEGWINLTEDLEGDAVNPVWRPSASDVAP